MVRVGGCGANWHSTRVVMRSAVPALAAPSTLARMLSISTRSASLSYPTEHFGAAPEPSTLHPSQAVLMANECIADLGLRGNALGARGAVAGAFALMGQRCGVTSLDLAHNSLGPEGATVVARALAKSKSLTALSLGRNGIGCAGATSVARAIAHNRRGLRAAGVGRGAPVEHGG